MLLSYNTMIGVKKIINIISYIKNYILTHGKSK